MGLTTVQRDCAACDYCKQSLIWTQEDETTNNESQIVPILWVLGTLSTRYSVTPSTRYSSITNSKKTWALLVSCSTRKYVKQSNMLISVP